MTLRAILTIAAALILAPLPEAPAQAREPLLMEGKTSLYRRVLVRDATFRHDAPGGAAGPVLRPLQPLFVYAVDGAWMQVGLGDAGEDLFWVEAEKTVGWRQNIVATFEGSEAVGRVLFFAHEDAAYDVVESEDPARAAARMREAARAAERGGAPSEDVVALGPRATPDLRENLYVMPILDSEEAVLESNGAFVNVLKVAVARADADGGPAPAAEAAASAIREAEPLPEVARGDFRAGVVLVVDTTVSMEPYIRGTRAALEEILRSLSGAEADNVAFGLIGYRDSLRAAPRLGYDVRTFVTLEAGRDPQAFLAGIDAMTEAEETSRNFREDSYAAINAALTSMDWAPYDARYIVLITDAGPREAGDEFSATGLTARALNTLVKEQLGAALAVLHLKTERGARDHADAEAAYRTLARQANADALYFDVPGGDEGVYRDAARRLGQAVVAQVAAFRDGADPEAAGIPETGSATGADRLVAALESAGRTMQLAYLGREGGTRAPDVFEAFVADRDFDRPGLKPLSVRLLLTKRELSDLDEAMRVILEKGEENVITPGEMFGQVLAAAADMSRRPDKVARNADTTLADAVSVSEMLEGLPYRSRIMTVTEEDWIRMPISEQQTILSDLREKVALFARFNANTDQWVDYLGTGAQAENLLYPMKLDDLP